MEKVLAALLQVLWLTIIGHTNNSTLTENHNSHVVQRTHELYLDPDYDDTPPPPTINPEICTATLDETSGLAGTLKQAFNSVTETQTNRRFTSTNAIAPMLQNHTDCQGLLNYIHKITLVLVSEVGKIRDANFTTTAEYEGLKSKFQRDISNLNKALDGLKLSQSQELEQLARTYADSLRTLKAEMMQLLDNNEQLRKDNLQKTYRLVALSIMAGNISSAKEHYNNISDPVATKLPIIITQAYSGPSAVPFIVDFIQMLPTYKDYTMALGQLYGVMERGGDITNPAVLYVSIYAQSIKDKDSAINAGITQVSNNFESRTQSVLSAWGQNIRRGQFGDIENFIRDRSGEEIIKLHMPSLMRATYTGRSDIDRIRQFCFSSLTSLSHQIPLLQGLLEKMPRDDLFSQEGLVVVHMIHRMRDRYWDSNIARDDKSGIDVLLTKLPDELKFTMAKYCNIKNFRIDDYFFAGYWESETYDTNRRYVFTREDGRKVFNTDWKILPIGNGDTFHIYNDDTKEYLFQSEPPFSYDSERHRIFTWRPGHTSAPGSDWSMYAWRILFRTLTSDEQARMRKRGQTVRERLMMIQNVKYYDFLNQSYMWDENKRYVFGMKEQDTWFLECDYNKPF